MSCDGYTLKLANGTEICIPIYREIDHWKGPDPDPKRQLFRDLATLVTIFDGVAHLSNREVRDTLSKSVQHAAKSLSLPEGMKLGDGLFNTERPFVAAK